jgi:hypothetical protein
MNVLDFLTGNGSGTGPSAIFNEVFGSTGLGLNNNLWNTIFSSGFYMPGNWLGTMTDLVGLQSAAGADAGAAAAGDAAQGAAAADGLGGAVAGPAAGLSELGALAVPPSWNAVAPTVSPLPAALGGMPLAPPPAVAAGMPGMPFANAAGNHVNGAAPKYGFRPMVVAHPPAAG